MPKRAQMIPQTTPPMEARLQDEIPAGEVWQYEPKWDGFRCLAFRDGKKVELRAKSGKPLTRYFPEIVAAVAALKPDRFVLDGELVISEGGVLSFDALQMRLHPAESRIRKLARETPARMVMFDMLMAPGSKNLMDAPLKERRAALEDFAKRIAKADSFLLSPQTRDVKIARRWLKSGGANLDGIVAKRLDEPYQPGERAMAKVKCIRTADCVVGGFRYAQGTRQAGSMLLGLYDSNGKLDHVGFTSGISNDERRALTKKLEALKGGSGFTGNAPGGPSRWSTERSGEWVALKPKLIAEVRYDHVTGGRFRHGTKFVRWRPDKSPKQCTCDQLVRETKPSELIAKLLRKA